MTRTETAFGIDRCLIRLSVRNEQMYPQQGYGVSDDE